MGRAIGKVSGVGRGLERAVGSGTVGSSAVDSARGVVEDERVLPLDAVELLAPRSVEHGEEHDRGNAVRDVERQGRDEG